MSGGFADVSTGYEKFRQFVTVADGAALVIVGMLVGFALSVTVVIADTVTFWAVLCASLVLISATAAWCAACAASATHGRGRAVWVCVTVGLVAWAAAAALSLPHVPGPEPPPVWADAGYVVFWLATGTALILLPALRFDPSWMRLVLDAVIVGGGLFAIAWLLFFHVAYENPGGGQGTDLPATGYLAATVVVTTVAVLLVARARGRQRHMLVVLAVGIIVMAVTRGTFAHLVFREAFDTAALVGIGWGAGLLLIGVAAVMSVHVAAEPAGPPLPPSTSLWLPYLPIVFTVALSASEFIGVPRLVPVLIATILMAGAVLARQFLVLRDNRRLVMTIAEQALHDPLTGVGNRALFDDRLTHAVHLRQRDRTPITVLVLDLDDFKFVNVSMGHPAGDALLVDVAERLLSCLRTGDTIARLGGDEFAILLEGGVESARAVAHRVVQCFDEPFVLDGEPVLIRPSIGLVALSGQDADVAPEVVLKRADAAMYAVKSSGTGGLRVYSPDLDAPGGDPAPGAGPGPGAGGTPGAAVHLLGELRMAIDRAELLVVYQPQVDLRTNAIIGLEALMRWPHPRLGLLEPDRFLPLIRQHGLMPAVTDLVLGKALDQLSQWHAQRCATRIAVNLVAPSLSDLVLPSSIAAELGRRGLPPELLTIEITEDLMLEDVRRTATVLRDLRARGIRIAIDDFGSGYSALSYLRELPIDEMKICRQLVTPIIGDPRAEAVVRTVVDLAHVLGATVVAEGVENHATGERLRELGCDIVQGYHYFRPLATEAVTELLRTQRRRFDNAVTG